MVTPHVATDLFAICTHTFSKMLFLSCDPCSGHPPGRIQGTPLYGRRHHKTTYLAAPNSARRSCGRRDDFALRASAAGCAPNLSALGGLAPAWTRTKGDTPRREKESTSQRGAVASNIADASTEPALDGVASGGTPTTHQQGCCTVAICGAHSRARPVE